LLCCKTRANPNTPPPPPRPDVPPDDDDSDDDYIATASHGAGRRGSRRSGCAGRNQDDLLTLDPKRVKRILANRLSAARSKERRMKHAVELETRVKTLDNQLARLSRELETVRARAAAARAAQAEADGRAMGLQKVVTLARAANQALVSELFDLQRTMGLPEQMPAVPAASPDCGGGGAHSPQQSIAGRGQQHGSPAAMQQACHGWQGGASMASGVPQPVVPHTQPLGCHPALLPSASEPMPMGRGLMDGATLAAHLHHQHHQHSQQQRAMLHHHQQQHLAHLKQEAAFQPQLMSQPLAMGLAAGNGGYGPAGGDMGAHRHHHSASMGGMPQDALGMFGDPCALSPGGGGMGGAFSVSAGGPAPPAILLSPVSSMVVTTQSGVPGMASMAYGGM
jgi:hypothetical protein